MPPVPLAPSADARTFDRRRAFAYAIDAGPIWLAQYLGVGRVIAALGPVYVLGIGVFDPATGKPTASMMNDLPDAADLALHWVPGLCVLALFQALAIDLLGSSLGALGAGLSVARAGGGAPSRARLFVRELLRGAPAACAMIVAGVLAELDAQEAAFWVLVTGFGLALAAAAYNGVCFLRGGRSLLDVISGTIAGPGNEALAAASAAVP